MRLSIDALILFVTNRAKREDGMTGHIHNPPNQINPQTHIIPRITAQKTCYFIQKRLTDRMAHNNYYVNFICNALILFIVDFDDAGKGRILIYNNQARAHYARFTGRGEGGTPLATTPRFSSIGPSLSPIAETLFSGLDK
jgi:hypothetical protein